MKKILIIGVLALSSLNIANADGFFTNLGNKTQNFVDDVSDATSDTAQNVKYGTKKAVTVTGETVKNGAKATGEAFKTGSKKVGHATKNGATKATNATARGVKYSAGKLEKSADKIIQKTSPKVDCTCGQKIYEPEKIEEHEN